MSATMTNCGRQRSRTFSRGLAMHNALDKLKTDVLCNRGHFTRDLLAEFHKSHRAYYGARQWRTIMLTGLSL